MTKIKIMGDLDQGGTRELLIYLNIYFEDKLGDTLGMEMRERIKNDSFLTLTDGKKTMSLVEKVEWE